MTRLLLKCISSSKVVELSERDRRKIMQLGLFCGRSRILQSVVNNDMGCNGCNSLPDNYLPFSFIADELAGNLVCAKSGFRNCVMRTSGNNSQKNDATSWRDRKIIYNSYPIYERSCYGIQRYRRRKTNFILGRLHSIDYCRMVNFISTCHSISIVHRNPPLLLDTSLQLFRIG